MKDNYLISVIVPVYNTAKYLNRCLESLMMQDYPSYEVILVDDGSTDESPKMCDDIAGRDERFKVIHKENGGLVSAWKRGVLASEGEYLCFVDSDDWVSKDMLIKLSEYLSGSSSEIISSDYIIEREDTDGFKSENVYQIIPPGIYEGDNLKNEVVPKLLGNENRYVTFSRCMKLISRDLIINNMDYAKENLRMGEDLSVMFPALIDCTRLVIPERLCLYHYLYVKESMVHNYSRTLLTDIENLYDACKKTIEDKIPTDYMKEALDREFIYLLFLIVKNEVRGNVKEYKANIRALNLKYRDKIEKVKVSVTQMSNKLVYSALKNPSAINLFLLRLAIIIYYR